MKAIDFMPMIPTKEGNVLPNPEEIRKFEAYMGRPYTFKTEEELIKDFRDADIKAIPHT